MTVTLNSTGSYTIDLPSAIKLTYPDSVIITIDDVIVSSPVLPYTYIFDSGVHSIDVYLTGPSGTYREKKCVLTDKDLLCKLTSYVFGLEESIRYDNQAFYIYYLLNKGLDTMECTCQCTDLKTIYLDLIKMIECKDCC